MFSSFEPALSPPAVLYRAADYYITIPAEYLQNKEGGQEVVKPMVPAAGDGQTSAPGAPHKEGATAPEGPGLLGMLWPLLIMFALMYFLVMRPEKKRQKQAAEMRSNIKKGDKVLLSGGMLGTIAGIADDWLTIEIADKVRVQFQKSAIVSVVDTKEKSDATTAAK